MTRATAVALFLAAACLCAAPRLPAQNLSFPTSAVPERGARVRSFVPDGWKAATQVSGDLNGDGRPDHVVYVVPPEHDPDAIGASPEAHALLILLADARGGLRLGGVAKYLLQTMAPQFGLRLTIRRGVLVVNQNYGMTDVADLTHRFRLERETGWFLLIGQDVLSYHRPQELADVVKTSDNFLTGERLITTGHYGADGYRETVRRERIPRTKDYFHNVNVQYET